MISATLSEDGGAAGKANAALAIGQEGAEAALKGEWVAVRRLPNGSTLELYSNDDKVGKGQF